MAWEKGEPVEGILAPRLNDVIRDNNDALEIALNKEMNFSTGGVASLQGILKQGSARSFFQDSAPATRVDGSAFASTDLGMLWIDSNSSPINKLSILTATTPTWTPVSNEIIAVLLAANRVFAGIITLGDGSKLATSAAPTADAMIVNKKTLDDVVGNKADGQTPPVTTGYQVYAVNGTPTKVYTKFYTGNLTGGDTKTIAHGIANGETKILSMALSCGRDTESVQYFSEIDASGSDIADWGVIGYWSATHITIKPLGTANNAGNRYTVEVKYIQ